MVFCISGHFYHPVCFLLRKKAPRHHADVPGGFAILEEAGRCGTPCRGKLVDQLVMSCAVDGEPGLAAVVGKHKGGSKCRGGKGYRHAQGHGPRCPAGPEQTTKKHPEALMASGCSELELLSRFELETSSLPRMRSTN